MCAQAITYTVWHEIFAGVYFYGLAIFCVLRELIFAISSDWFFLLGINICVPRDIQSSSSLPFITNFNLFVTDFNPYFKDVIQYYFCQFSPMSA